MVVPVGLDLDIARRDFTLVALAVATTPATAAAITFAAFALAAGRRQGSRRILTFESNRRHITLSVSFIDAALATIAPAAPAASATVAFGIGRGALSSGHVIGQGVHHGLGC